MPKFTWQSFGGDHRVMRHFMNAWPPFSGSGVHIDHLGADFRTARESLNNR